MPWTISRDTPSGRSARGAAACRYAVENIAILRRLAVNLLRRGGLAKVTVRTEHVMAGWEKTYLRKVLSACDAGALRSRHTRSKISVNDVYNAGYTEK